MTQLYNNTCTQEEKYLSTFYPMDNESKHNFNTKSKFLSSLSSTIDDLFSTNCESNTQSTNNFFDVNDPSFLKFANFPNGNRKPPTNAKDTAEKGKQTKLLKKKRKKEKTTKENFYKTANSALIDSARVTINKLCGKKSNDFYNQGLVKIHYLFTNRPEDENEEKVSIKKPKTSFMLIKESLDQKLSTIFKEKEQSKRYTVSNFNSRHNQNIILQISENEKFAKARPILELTFREYINIVLFNEQTRENYGICNLAEVIENYIKNKTFKKKGENERIEFISNLKEAITFFLDRFKKKLK